MATDRPRRDARLTASRYRLDPTAPSDSGQAEKADAAGRITPEERAGMVEIAIQQAMRRGDFDDLPGAGKPIPGLDRAHDPDWWIRRKIEREGLTGLGPPALTLRTEDSQLQARIDALSSESAVRELVEGFNRRVIEARRQLLGGPPVITAPRDVAAEVAGWRQRREARAQAREQQRDRDRAAAAAMSWRERRRAKRGRA